MRKKAMNYLMKAAKSTESKSKSISSNVKIKDTKQSLLPWGLVDGNSVA